MLYQWTEQQQNQHEPTVAFVPQVASKWSSQSVEMLPMWCLESWKFRARCQCYGLVWDSSGSGISSQVEWRKINMLYIYIPQDKMMYNYIHIYIVSHSEKNRGTNWITVLVGCCFSMLFYISFGMLLVGQATAGWLCWLRSIELVPLETIRYYDCKWLKYYIYIYIYIIL